jgi:hypothetical protein
MFPLFPRRGIDPRRQAMNPGHRTGSGAREEPLGRRGAGRFFRHERSAERVSYRNGYRDRSLDTRVGSLQLRIPKLRQGSYFPPFLEPRKTSERALVAVIQEAWIGGISTRRVDDLVQAMGLSGISKSQVSKLCKDIDERVHAFLSRPLTGEWPYLWLDATSLRAMAGRSKTAFAFPSPMPKTKSRVGECPKMGARAEKLFYLHPSERPRRPFSEP